MPEWWNW